MTWQMSSFFGWGVYGLNLALNWAGDPDLQLLCAQPVTLDRLAVDPLSLLALQPTLEASAELVRRFEAHAGQDAATRDPVLYSLDESFRPRPAAHGVRLTGKPNIGVVFLETAQLAPEAVELARRFDLIVTGSSWNETMLKAYGLDRVRNIFQGVDRTLFHPGLRRGLLADRFLVFSGGKLERRKGQDLVIAAFRIFAERHPDALLVTAWHSPWPQLASSLDASGVAAPIPFRDDGKVDVIAWATASGIAPSQILDLGTVANIAMPAVLREVDVALFPNRREGGTNLVSMEAMACGCPVILSANTGHLDLIEGENCYPLMKQAPLPGREAGALGVPGPGESDVEEIVAALEAAYADRDEARRRGAAGAETVSRFAWSRTAAEMKAALLDLA